ncbi:MAG TPA: hypothetical protein ENK23_04365, partial [Sorangium sp.]|nr:hypothetical protein [Sorangium sp.]
MPRPTSVAVRGYRAFARPQQLQLRPLTLLYGRNNAGKSALVRLLPIIEASLDLQLTTPLNLDAPAAGDSSFARLTWAHDQLYQMEIKLSWDHAPITSVRYSIKGRDD